MSIKKVIISAILILTILSLGISLISGQSVRMFKENEMQKMDTSEVQTRAAGDDVRVSLTKSAQWVDISQGIAKVTLTQQGTQAEYGNDVIIVVDMSGSMTFLRPFFDRRPEYDENGHYDNTPNINGPGTGWRFSACTNPDHYTSKGKHYYNPKNASGEEDDYDYDHGCTDRFQVAMNSVMTFAELFLSEKNTKNKVALIGFNAEENRDENDGYGTYFTNNLTRINNRINKMYENLNKGTDYGDAMSAASAMLAERKAELGAEFDKKKTYVLFLTDGVPSPTSATGIPEARNLKNTYKNTTVYAIGIGNQEDEDFADKYLKDIASSEETCIRIEQESELVDKFEDIAHSLVYVGKDVTLEDNISTYFDYYEDETHQPSPTPSSARGQVIQWKEAEIPEQAKTYTFYIKIKDQYVPRHMADKFVSENDIHKYTNK